MKWSEKTWQNTLPIYEKILQLPFIEELIQGSLPKEKFFFYLQQDAIYLADYGKVLSAIAAKLSKSEHSEAFLHFAADSIAVEKALHESFLKDIPSNHPIEASPSCLLYTSYLLRQLTVAPIESTVAAVLPCFWIYQEVGNYILSKQIKKNNPYQNWIDTYGGEDFANAVTRAINICDELAEQCTPVQQEAMTKAFLMASKFEWMFWDSAYNKESWKV